MASGTVTRAAYLVAVLAMGVTVDQPIRFEPDPYGDALSRALLPADGCIVQLVAIPSFRSEWSLCVVQDAGGARIEFTTIDPMLYGEMMRHIYEADETPEDGVYVGWEAEEQALRTFTPAVRRRSAPLARDTVAALETLWRSAMAHPRQRLPGIDGESYYLGVRTGAPRVGDWFTWSPRRGTPEAAFMGFARRLVEYAKEPQGTRAALERAISIDALSVRSRFAAE